MFEIKCRLIEKIVERKDYSLEIWLDEESSLDIADGNNYRNEELFKLRRDLWKRDAPHLMAEAMQL